MQGTDSRELLARRQADLLRALLEGAAIDGIDQGRTVATAESLRSKRIRSVARAWPRTAQSLDDRFATLFALYASERGSPPHGPLADGAAFVQWLARRESPRDEIRVEALSVRLRTRFDRNGLCRVRRVGVVIGRLPQAARTLVAVRLVGRELWLRVW